jgi:excinuclease ABC subunit C
VTTAPSTPLAATLKNLPDRPGVYLMKNARGDVLYVGKAQSLRSRVRSYWQKEAAGGEQHP